MFDFDNIRVNINKVPNSKKHYFPIKANDIVIPVEGKHPSVVLLEMENENNFWIGNYGSMLVEISDKKEKVEKVVIGEVHLDIVVDKNLKGIEEEDSIHFEEDL